MMLNYCAKNEVKRSSHSGEFYVKKIKQSDWESGFWGQSSRSRPLNCLKQVNHFAVSISAYHYAKKLALYLSSVLTYCRFAIGV